jgi:3',5'-cyclic-AMP phosphodiesterase
MIENPMLSFSVTSDLHFMAWKETDAPVEWVSVLEDALEDIHSLHPQFLVVNGDLTNGKDRDYRLAMRVLNDKCRKPIYYTMGNHEYYGYWEQSDYPDQKFSLSAAQQRFLDYTGMESIYYEKHIVGLPFLFLSTERYNSDLKDAGWLSPEQLAWLKKRMQPSPEGPMFVFFHQPVNGTVAESNETCIQSEELKTFFAERPGIILFTGHTHCRMDRTDQIFSDRKTLYVGGGCLHNDSSQSRWVDVYDDRIVLRLRDHKNRQWLSDFDFEWALRV